MNRIRRSFVCASFCVALLAMASVSRAQSPFDGTWRTDPARSKFDQKPFTIYTSQGWYHCVGCIPPYDIAADGQFHPVSGQPFDELSVTIVDPHTLAFVDRKDGRKIGEGTVTVSADGKLLVSKDTNYPANGAGPQDSSITLKRAGTLPPGVHATSGNWVPLKFSDTAADLTFTYKSNGDEFSMTDPTGDSYTAKFDGNDYPYKGSSGTNYTVSLKRINAHTIEETDKRDGKVLDIQTITVSSDGKTLTTVSHDPRNDTTSTFVSIRM